MVQEGLITKKEAILRVDPDQLDQMLHPNIHPALEQKSLAVYLFHAYIWPGKRVTYDGKPVVLPEPTRDEQWIPKLDSLPADASLGAEA